MPSESRYLCLKEKTSGLVSQVWIATSFQLRDAPQSNVNDPSRVGAKGRLDDELVEEATTAE